MEVTRPSLWVAEASKVRITGRARLQVKHAGNQLQAILDTVVDLLEQDLMAIERRLQFALVPLLFDRHAEDICSPLQEGDIVLTKLALGSAVHF